MEGSDLAGILQLICGVVFVRGSHVHSGEPKRFLSSYALEVAANEYTCQGLELDYVGLCWDGDLRWDPDSLGWKPYRLSGSQWQTVKDTDSMRWSINKYRVLLSRARVATIIWVPEGCARDPTRDPNVRDEIAATLLAAGARHHERSCNSAAL